MRLSFVALFVLSFLSFNAPLSAQQGNGHICQRHPETTHDRAYKRIELSAGHSTPLVTPGPSTWVTVFTHEDSNNTCFPTTVTATTSKAVTHTVTVGGSITVGASIEAAAGVLFSKLKFTANAQGTFNKTWTDTVTESIQISSQIQNPKCNKVKYVFEKLQQTASGTIGAWDHQIVCINVNTKKKFYNYCNKVTLSGNATGWGDSRGGWHQLGKSDACPCEEPPVVSDPDVLPEPVDETAGRQSEVQPEPMERGVDSVSDGQSGPSSAR